MPRRRWAGGMVLSRSRHGLVHAEPLLCLRSRFGGADWCCRRGIYRISSRLVQRAAAWSAETVGEGVSMPFFHWTKMSRPWLVWRRRSRNRVAVTSRRARRASAPGGELLSAVPPSEGVARKPGLPPPPPERSCHMARLGAPLIAGRLLGIGARLAYVHVGVLFSSDVLSRATPRWPCHL